MTSSPILSNPKLDYEDINDLQVSDSMPLGYEGYAFISQSRYDGGSISLLQGDEIISIGSSSYSLNSTSPYPSLFQSEYVDNLDTTWIDLDGEISYLDDNGDLRTPEAGEQGNRSGDDLIIGFDQVYYSEVDQNGNPLPPHLAELSNIAIAQLRDEQGEYFIVQDRSGNTDNQGTDTLRRVDTLNLNGQVWDLTGSGEGAYYFSENNYDNKDIWIDLDGEISYLDDNGDLRTPEAGEQGNRSGDDLIIGFDQVYYSEVDQNGNPLPPHLAELSNIAIAQLRDEQGEYFIVQDRSGNTDNQGTDTLRRVDTLNLNGQVWDLTGSGEGAYYFSENNYDNKDIWIDLDGEISYLDDNGDLRTPEAGEQGNRSGDDLIIGFDQVYYSEVDQNGNPLPPHLAELSNIAIAQLRDEQGEYFIVQDRSGNTDNQGTDTLRRVDTLNLNGQVWDLTGSGEGAYYFSENNYDNKDIWIDLDGEISYLDDNGDLRTPEAGEQGNRSGDDLIIGFDQVYYSEVDQNGNPLPPHLAELSNIAIAQLRDEQGEYFIVQDRSGNTDNQGTDTLRRVDTLNLNGQVWDLTGSGEGAYYFSENNYDNKDIWIDLDGEISYLDDNGDLRTPEAGEQGNRSGDDLIIGFDQVYYSEVDQNGNPLPPHLAELSNIAIAQLRDEQGEYFIVQDRSGNTDNQGTDTLRRVDTLNLNGQVWDLTGSGEGAYYFSENNYDNKDIWIDLDGEISYLDDNGDLRTPEAGEQGNRSGDDLIIGFDQVYYSEVDQNGNPLPPHLAELSNIAIAQLRDEQGEYFIVQDRSGNTDNQGTDTLRRVDTLNLNGQVWDLTGSGEGAYYFSENNYDNKDIWIDLDGEISYLDDNGDLRTPEAGEQGNRSGDDLIIGFDQVYYSEVDQNGNPLPPHLAELSNIAIAQLRDEQGEYFIVQDRSGNTDNQGTDTLRRVDTLNLNGQVWDLTGSGEGAYYFSENNYDNKDIWIDLDGEISYLDDNGDLRTPEAGEQGNRSGDDLIIGFDQVYYSEVDQNGNPLPPHLAELSNIAIAQLRDEQGEYFIVQDRSGNTDNQGTDTLRRVDTLNLNGQVWDLTGSGEGAYYFSENNYDNKDIWIDLDGEISYLDDNGDLRTPEAGEQGNRSGDDLIIGFDQVYYSEVDQNGNPLPPHLAELSNIAIAQLRDEQGEYFIVQDRSGNTDNQGTDTLRRVDTLNLNGQVWDLTGSGEGAYYFSENNYDNKDIWIDLDGEISYLDDNGDLRTPEAGEQGNRSGDDLIIGFDQVYYSEVDQNGNPLPPHLAELSNIAIAQLRDEQGEYFIVQDRSGNTDNQGTDTLRRVDTLNLNGQVWDLTGSGEGAYYFSENNYDNKDIWIDLDGEISYLDDNGDLRTPEAGEQGNRSGDDLIIGFDQVYYSEVDQNGNPLPPHLAELSNIAIAQLRDEQGEYFIVQDRSGNTDNQGTDTLRRVDTLNLNGQVWDLTGSGEGAYYFSENNYDNKDIWIDLDGEISYLDDNGDLRTPEAGEQGNRSGDDLIIGFDQVYYSEVDQNGNPLPPHLAELSNIAIAQLRDEQGEYFIVQDRSGNTDNQGTDTLRRVDTLNLNGQVWDLTGSGEGAYYFSENNYDNKDIWIDLDGEISYLDDNGDLRTPEAGEQGNRSGDDLIIGFDQVYYSEVDQNGNPLPPHLAELSNIAIAQLRDEQGEYFIVQDRSGNTDNQGTDTLRRVDTLNLNGQVWDLTGSGEGAYYFSENNYDNKDIWIDLDGEISYLDDNGDLRTPEAGEQGNRSGDDLIIGFDQVYYSEVDQNGNPLPPHLAELSNIAIAQLRDEQGEYFIVQDRSGNTDNQGTDTLRRVDTLNLNGQVWDLTGSGEGAYYFSENNYDNKDIWIDLDGEISYLDDNGDLRTPEAGEQGNRSGDDLIIGFDQVYYSEVDQNGNPLPPHLAELSNIAIAQLRDEQGEYFIVQDRSGNTDNQGTDTLRRVDTLNLNGQVWDLTGSGEGAYYFSENNYDNKDIWIDLDGEISYLDDNGDLRTPEAGEQGNRSGDDLIIGFDQVYYSEVDQNGNPLPPHLAELSNIAIAQLRDEQGEYFIVQDRSGNTDNQGTDTLRRVDTLNLNGQVWDLTGSGEGAYYFSENNYDNKDIWIDLDGEISYLDDNGDLRTPEAGEQGNRSGDDLIIGFDELRLDGVMSDYRITKARDTDGYFYKVDSENFSYGSDTLRDVGSIVFDDSVYLFDESVETGDRALHLQALLTSDSFVLPQAAVLGDSVDHNSSYSLLITGESLKDEYTIESADITLHFDPLLFGEINASDVRIGGDLPIANAVEIDNQAGTLRLAAASLAALNAGNGVSKETVLASINLDFDEVALATIDKNADGSLVTNPLTFSLSANADETVFSKDFIDTTGLLNREIVTLNDLGGYVAVDSQDVTLYEAKINFEQQGDGLVLGTQRVIGADATFTNLIRSGDTLTTSVDWLNVGNIEANNLNYSEIYNQNATLNSAVFSQTSVASGSFIDGVFVEDARESTTLTTDIKVTGQAGNVLDLSDGIVSIQADGSETFTNSSKGSSNLITFKGDLNYDGRVSMKDLAYLNAGAARQELVDGFDENGNSVEVASAGSYAPDVDADFSGKIDLADLAVLDQDWGKTLHSGDEQFQGSVDVSWNDLDVQGNNSTWDNSSFKDQNAIEAESAYVGSLESPAAAGVIGGDGNTTSNDNDITGNEFQDPLAV